MKVLKFGGTSVGSAERIMEVARLIWGRGRNLIVLSAMSGTTNSLVEISNLLKAGLIAEAEQAVARLEKKYDSVINQLFAVVAGPVPLSPLSEEEAAGNARAAFEKSMALIRSKFNTPLSLSDEKEILAQGELISTSLMHQYLLMRGVRSVLLPALDFMRIDADGEPDLDYITEKINPRVESYPEAQVFITQGFICRGADGGVDNLQRGGSDYTASLLGAALEAEEIEIWTDIDGMHNNDPRYVEGTRPVHRLHFDEAAELAYFGAKILHPTCVRPAKKKNIPVRLLNTMQPEAEGTLICNAERTHTIKAVAAKDNITAIKIKSSRMLLAYGFLRKVFEIFETHRTPIDMIVTSEVGVSITIDDESRLESIVEELKALGSVSVDRDMAILCVVGDMDWQNRGFEAEVVNALRDIPVRMISYGGSNYNISILVRQADKIKALNSLSRHLFESGEAATPYYQYDLELLDRTLRAVTDAAAPYGFRVHYAMKANSNPQIMRRVCAAGLGIDAVSGGEIRLATECGFKPDSIVYAGVGKRDDEIRLALKSGIGCFNVESIPELENIAAIAAEMGLKAPVALRINPDIDAHTHEYITTSLAENKFGIPMQSLDEAVDKTLSLPTVELRGLHFHIGSQVTITEPFRLLAERVGDLLDRLQGRGVSLRSVNMGGGLGINYDDPDANPIPDFKAYFEAFASLPTRHPEVEVHFELGRAIVAQCGSLITKVLYVKEGLDKNFVIVDAGMTDLIRPALYGAHHKIENLTARDDDRCDGPLMKYDVVGPVCESSDIFGQGEMLPLTRRGDILALRSAGAYGEVMASQYNCRPLPSSRFC